MKTTAYRLITSSILLASMAGHAEPASTTTAVSETPATAAVQEDRVNKFKPIILPFYDPSIKAGVMAVPIYAFYPDENDTVSDASTIALPMIYTNNGSYILKATSDIILLEDKLRFVSEFGYTSTNSNMLPGIETNKQSWEFEGDVYYKIFKDFYLGAGLVYENTRYIADQKKDQTALNSAGFRDEFKDDKGIRFGFQWDTRDQYYYPYSGFMWDTKYESHNEWIGNDKDNTYASLFTDFRYFHSIKDDPNNIVATRLMGRYLFDPENAPNSAFTTYGRQGKEVQRGYEVGQYTHANMINLEAEYRHRLSNTGHEILDKSTVVGIAGIGKSFGIKADAHRTDVSFSDAEVLGVIGVGYRYNIMPYERINIKVDLTVNSDGDIIAYFGVGETI